MFASTRFELLSTPHKVAHEIGFLKTTELPLSSADADSATAVLQRGKIVDYKDNDETLMKLGTGYGVGMLMRNISLNGLRTLAGYQAVMEGGYPDTPVSRGLAATILCPHPGFEAIFEGLCDITSGVAAAIDHLVVTTGTGALSAATPINTQLSVVNGAWRVAQAGNYVLAHMRQANLAPKNVGELRIRVRFCSPYLL